MPSPRAVIFDMDGLMFDTENIYSMVGTELLRRRAAALYAIDRSDPSQTMANLTGDTMQAHALAVSVPGELPEESSYQLGGPNGNLQPSSSIWAWETGSNLTNYRAAIQDPLRFGVGGAQRFVPEVKTVISTRN